MATKPTDEICAVEGCTRIQRGGIPYPICALHYQGLIFHHDGGSAAMARDKERAMAGIHNPEQRDLV